MNTSNPAPWASVTHAFELMDNGELVAGEIPTSVKERYEAELYDLYDREYRTDIALKNWLKLCTIICGTMRFLRYVRRFKKRYWKVGGAGFKKTREKWYNNTTLFDNLAENVK